MCVRRASLDRSAKTSESTPTTDRAAAASCAVRPTAGKRLATAPTATSATSWEQLPLRMQAWESRMPAAPAEITPVAEETSRKMGTAGAQGRATVQTTAATKAAVET